jgi:Fur family transcriptional regulator, peroxide stress response regulator
MTLATDFRALCHRHRLAATHQRQVIYEAVTSLAGHPGPEAIYDKVRRKVPSISLATVYSVELSNKNIRFPIS